MRKNNKILIKGDKKKQNRNRIGVGGSGGVRETLNFRFLKNESEKAPDLRKSRRKIKNKNKIVDIL